MRMYEDYDVLLCIFSAIIFSSFLRFGMLGGTIKHGVVLGGIVSLTIPPVPVLIISKGKYKKQAFLIQLSLLCKLFQ